MTLNGKMALILRYFAEFGSSMDDTPSLKGAWLCYVNHLNFGGHQPYLWNGWNVSLEQIL